jgi:hypothetical protein
MIRVKLICEVIGFDVWTEMPAVPMDGQYVRITNLMSVEKLRDLERFIEERGNEFWDRAKVDFLTWEQDEHGWFAELHYSPYTT